jgi:hypothetical protein
MAGRLASKQAPLRRLLLAADLMPVAWPMPVAHAVLFSLIVTARFPDIVAACAAGWLRMAHNKRNCWPTRLGARDKQLYRLRAAKRCQIHDTVRLLRQRQRRDAPDLLTRHPERFAAIRQDAQVRTVTQQHLG